MVLFFRGAAAFVGTGEEVVFFEKTHLQAVPAFFGIEHLVGAQFFEQGLADLIKIIAAQIVEVSITEDGFEVVAGALRYLGGHDHVANALDLFLAIVVVGEMFLG